MIIKLAAALATAAVLVVGSPAVAQAPTPKPRLIRPCSTEDAVSMRACVWDAKHMGNGRGTSFIYIKASGGTVIHITHKQAHSLLRWN